MDPQNSTGVLGAVGDLVEDVVVLLHESLHVASDTPSTVTRRRGGSAANVVEAARRAGGRARFIGQVGDDAVGSWLVRELEELGAEVAVRTGGRTGTVVVLVDSTGERSMLPDRAAATALDRPEHSWLDGLHTLHVPFYSLVGEPLATTVRTLAMWAHERGIAVSVDASSVSVLEHVGVETSLDLMASLAPEVVLANELEAATLGDGLTPARLGATVVVVKHGADPAEVRLADGTTRTVPAIAVPGVRDTTGAGDGFAAGFLIEWAASHDAVAATRHGHDVAAAAVRRASGL